MSVMSRAAQRLKALVTMGRVKSSSAGAGASGRVVVDTLGGADDLRVVQPYGLASRPASGAEAVIVQVGSNSDQAIVIAIDDRRYRIALEGGEVALYDDLGSRVLLKRGGVVEVEATQIKLGAGATRAAARFGDSVVLAADWLVWLEGLALAAGYPTAAPGTPPGTSSLGTIGTGSAKVVVE